MFLWDNKIITTFNIKKSEISTKLPNLKDLECSFEVSNGAPSCLYTNIAYYLGGFATYKSLK